MSTIKGIRKAIRDGLAANIVDSNSNTLLLVGDQSGSYTAKQKIIPMRHDGKIPAKPRIEYGFFSAWQHDAGFLEHNPPTLASIQVVPETTTITSGTATYPNKNRLYDQTADFITAGVTAWTNIKNTTTNAETFVVRVRDGQELILGGDIFQAIGDGYEIHPQSVQQTYYRPSLLGLTLAISHTTEELADEIAEKIGDFFKLPSQANALLKPLGFRVIDPGAVVVTDFIEETQQRARRRDITVTLKGNEMLTEDIRNVVDFDVTTTHETAERPDFTPVIDRPEVPGEFVF